MADATNDTNTITPTYQANKSITKQPGLTVRTTHVRGDYDTLEQFIERAKVGLPPPVDTGWSEGAM